MAKTNPRYGRDMTPGDIKRLEAMRDRRSRQWTLPKHLALEEPLPAVTVKARKGDPVHIVYPGHAHETSPTMTFEKIDSMGRAYLRQANGDLTLTDYEFVVAGPAPELPPCRPAPAPKPARPRSEKLVAVNDQRFSVAGATLSRLDQAVTTLSVLAPTHPLLAEVAAGEDWHYEVSRGLDFDRDRYLNAQVTLARLEAAVEALMARAAA